MTTPHLCPLCGGPNDCGIAAGSTTCWCFSVDVPAAVVEQVPAEERDRACVCRRCAESGGPTGSEGPEPPEPA